MTFVLFFSKTLELDEIRYNEVHVGTMRLLLIATIMTVFAHLTGSILKDYESIKTTLKSEMIILLEDFPQKKFVEKRNCFSFFDVVLFLFSFRKLKEILISLSEQIVKSSREQLTKFDKEKLIVENEEKLKESIRSIGDQHVIEHPVFKLLCKSKMKTKTKSKTIDRFAFSSKFNDTLILFIN